MREELNKLDISICTGIMVAALGLSLPFPFSSIFLVVLIFLCADQTEKHKKKNPELYEEDEQNSTRESDNEK